MKTTLSPSNPLCWRKVLPAVLVALLTLAAAPLRAQYFDWVRTYQSTHSSGTGSPDEDNMVLDMDADSQGNVYFLGRFVRGAAINGEELLEEVNTFNPPNNLINLCIVKMSPQGEMVWHKAISEWSMHQSKGEIQLVGDSALVCYVGIEPPRGPYPNEPVYWLDSLIQYPDWFIPTDSIWTGTALITLDLDGNLKEQHFLNVGFLDTLGVPIMSEGASYPTSTGLNSMHVDSEGNIILGVTNANERAWCKVRCDTCEHLWQTVEYTVENGGIGTVRILVDGVRTISYRPENRPIRTNAKLLKFSPHFDSLLEVRYLMQSRLDSPRTGLGVPGITKSEILHITSDPEGNIYVVGHIDISGGTDTIVPIDSTQGLSLHLSGLGSSFLVKYDSHLQPVFAKQLDGGVISGFNHCVVKDNDLFVLGGQGSSGPDFHYDNEIMSDISRGALLLRLNKNDGSLISYGKATPCRNNESGPGVESKTTATIAVNNNRVATQIGILGNVAFAGDTIRVPESPYRGRGFVIWDYEGHQLKVVDYHAPHPDNQECGTLFTDSSLYLCGMFNGEATFGDTYFNVSRSNGYIARYVDTSFLHPYVHPEHPDTGDVRIVLAESGVAFVAYPNPFRQRVTIIYSGSDPIASAFITDMLGRREPVSLLPLPADAGGSTRFVADLTTAPQATYLLTLVTASGHQHTLRLFKQSDLFED